MPVSENLSPSVKALNALLCVRSCFCFLLLFLRDETHEGCDTSQWFTWLNDKYTGGEKIVNRIYLLMRLRLSKARLLSSHFEVYKFLMVCT